MGKEITLTVPAEHVAAFRRAAVYEVKFDGECIVSAAEELLGKDGARWPNGPELLGDLRPNALRSPINLGIAEQVLGDESAKVRGDLEILLAIAETMARQTSKQLAEELDYAPVDPSAAVAPRASLDWALARVEELQAAWRAEREAVAA